MVLFVCAGKQPGDALVGALETRALLTMPNFTQQVLVLLVVLTLMPTRAQIVRVIVRTLILTLTLMLLLARILSLIYQEPYINGKRALHQYY